MSSSACFSGSAWAHKASDSYLVLVVQGQSVNGQWDIALRDIDFALGLDSNGDGDITWGELRTRHAAVSAWALGRLNLQRGGSCDLKVTQHQVDEHTDGAYAVLAPERARQSEFPGYRQFSPGAIRPVPGGRRLAHLDRL